jgi:Tfp pilus assembly protein PilF
LPVVALLLDLLVARRRFADAIKPIFIWILLTIPILVIAWRAQPAQHATSPIAIRPLVILDAIAFYTYKVLVPLRYAVDYGRSPQWLMDSAQKYWTWIVPVILAIVSIATYRKFRWLSIGILVFVAGLLPVLGIFRFDYQIFTTVADHYAYVAMLGPAILLAGLLSLARGETWLRVAGVVLVLLAIRSFAQVRTWSDTRTLFEHTLQINPNSVAANSSLGVWWSEESTRQRIISQRNRQDQAYEAAQRAMDEAHQADLKSVGYYQKSVSVRPNDPYNNFNLGNAYMRAGDLPKAAEHIRRAIDNFKADPNDPQNNPASFYLNLGSVEGMQGHFEQAARAFEKALEYYDTPDIHVNLGNALFQMGNHNEAKQQYMRALQLDPRNRRAMERLFALSQAATTQSSTRPSTAPTTGAATRPATR